MKFHDVDNNKTLVFLTNNFDLPAFTITELYRCRWHIEVFFKWIKQPLRIKMPLYEVLTNHDAAVQYPNRPSY